MIRRVVLGILIALGAAAPGASVRAQAAAQATFKVAVFDAQAVSENTEIGKKIQADLTAFTDKKDAEIKERQAKLSEMRQQLSQQSLSLSSDKRVALEKDIQRYVLELQSLQESASRELDLEYSAATKTFREKLVVAIDAFGKEEGFSVILDRSQVAWTDPSVDVTSAIVDRFNKMFHTEAK
jgi:outer membrane protein